MSTDSPVPPRPATASLRKIGGWIAAVAVMLVITGFFWPKPTIEPYQLARIGLGNVGASHEVLKAPVAALAYTPYDAHAGMPGVNTSVADSHASASASASSSSGGTHNTSLLLSLDLTPDQLRKVEPVLDQARSDAEAHYGKATGDARRNILRDSMRVAFDKIKPLLTTGQQARLEQAYVQIGSAGSGATRGVVYILAGGKPKPIPVRVGESDGVFSVVQSYDLKAGDQVIVGGGPHAPQG